MDTFTFLVAILLMIIALQYGQNWIVFAILAITILSTRSVATTIALIVAVFVLYIFAGSGDLNTYWPFLVFGLIILSLVLGLGKKPAQPEYYSPDMGFGEGAGGF